MAARVSGQGGNESTEGPGVSYASVLNLQRAKDNNKENISRCPKPSLQTKERLEGEPKGKSCQKFSKRFSRSERYPSSKVPLDLQTNSDRNSDEKNLKKFDSENISEEQKSGHKLSEKEVVNGELGSDGDFQTVAPKSARRKEKLKEHKDHRERHRNRERHHLRGHSGGSKDRFKERIDNKDKERGDQKEEEEDEPVKYVEAPLPVVNPWIKGKSNSGPVPVPVPVVVSEQKAEKEKRILQPQQQQTKQIGKLLRFFRLVF